MNRPIEEEKDAGTLLVVLYRALALADACDAVAAAYVASAIERLQPSVTKPGGDASGADDP